MKNSIISASIRTSAFTALSLAATLHAETWYFTGHEYGLASSVNRNAFTDPSAWTDSSGSAAAAFSADDTYVLTNKAPGETAFTEHSILLHGGTFASGARLEVNGYGKDGERPAQKMHIQADSTPNNPTVFGNGLLLGHNAYLYPRSAGVPNVIEGEVSLIANDGGQNPRINPVEKNAGLIFDGPMTGASGKALMVYASSDGKKRNFSLEFKGDVTWKGSLYVRDYGSAIDVSVCDYNVRLVFGSIEFHPYFRIDGTGGTGSGVFRENNLMRLAVSSPDDTVTFKNGIDQSKYPFHHDTYLEFPVDAVRGMAGKMVSETVFHGSTNGNIGIILTGDLFGGTATNRFKLLSVPVEKPLNAASFYLVGNPEMTGTVVRFEVENDDENSVLYAVIPPMVRYLKNDNASQFAGPGRTSIGSAEAWSDGSVPTEGKDYLVWSTNATHKILRTPDSDETTSYTFPGDSLTIAGNASLRSYVSGLSIKKLRLLDGSALYMPQCTDHRIEFNGEISASGTVRIGTYSSHKAVFTNTVFTGAGTLDFGGMWIAANAHAQYVLPERNDRFFGKMILRTAYQNESSGSVPTSTDDFALMYLSSAASLGADLPELTYDALTLMDYAQLWVNGNITVAKPSNRGVTVVGNGRVWTSIGKSIRLETSLTVDGTFYKEGVGELTLACPGRAVTGGGADKVVVSHGMLRLASADALKGLALDFRYANDSGTRFEVAIDPDDAVFTEKGVDLSGLATPITLHEGLNGKIPFATIAEEDRLPAPFGTRDYGILTVDAAAADAVRAMLPAEPPRYFTGGALSWTESSDADAGTVTFAVRCERKALRVIVR